MTSSWWCNAAYLLDEMHAALEGMVHGQHARRQILSDHSLEPWDHVTLDLAVVFGSHLSVEKRTGSDYKFIFFIVSTATHLEVGLFWQDTDNCNKHCDVTWKCAPYYRQVSNTRRTKSQHLKDSHTVLLLPMPNPLKPDVKSRMKM